MNPAPANVEKATDPASAWHVSPHLSGVSETMLWALYNRATEAGRADGVLTDPDSISIHRAIDYDFGKHFGDPLGALAARGACIDQALRQWLAIHPDGLVVSLGEGLETQVRRVDNGRMRWLSVDLPDAIRLRAHFLPPTDRFRHLAVSALDPSWMKEVDPSHGVFIIAQGLLMYLRPEPVRALLCLIADRFPGAELVFDVVPRWFSRLTMIGLKQTPHYRLPDMPWGINRNELLPALRRWHPRLSKGVFLDYRVPRGLFRLCGRILGFVPVARNELPSLIHITIGSASCRSGNGKQQMTLNYGSETGIGNSGTLASNNGAMNDMLALATRNAESGGELAIAAGQVIAKRVALGMAAAVNPIAADHAEFARMMPEKVEAFSAAGKAMLEQSEEARSQLTRLASDEVMTTARATMEMARCGNPVAVMQAQGKFAQAWINRATSNFMAMGMMMLSAQAAALAPLQVAVAANTKRLG